MDKNTEKPVFLAHSVQWYKEHLFTDPLEKCLVAGDEPRLHYNHNWLIYTT